MLSAALFAAHLAAMTLRAPHANLHLEIAATQSTRERGLMERTALRVHTGMLFVFPTDGPVEFWMKNTRVPLDMIFVGRDGVVRSVSASVPVVPPWTPDDRIPRRHGNARFVIELPAGEAARDGLRPGITLGGLAAFRDA